MVESCVVVTPWHKEQQRDEFLSAWGITESCSYLILQHDADHEGCGFTKNKGIARAISCGFTTVVILDDDCFPTIETPTLQSLITQHCNALEPQPVEMFQTVTDPPSRGTPFNEHSLTMPVAASMGFWTEIGDYCAVRQLAFDCGPMEVKPQTIFGKYFPLCGMNLAFKPLDWLPWCDFIDVPRFDDIWMGWLWQREAYRRKHCFNLNGPVVRHSRQSNVWANLKDEAKFLQTNERLWSDIATSDYDDYESLTESLLPFCCLPE